MDGPDLSGRTALVTGSARGLGRELLLATAECGAKTAVHYNTSADEASQVTELAERRGAPAVTSVQGDVTDPNAVEAMFEAIEADLGRVDVLVNNVGDFAPAHWEEIDFETWNRVLETNINGTYLCSKRALGSMRSDGTDYGRIVNIGYASAEKQLVNPVNFPYFVAKSAVLSFTRMLAADTQNDEITVNAISPYVIENSEVFPDDLPQDRPARFDDIVRPLLFFLDPGTEYVSGENIEVDGGWLPETV